MNTETTTDLLAGYRGSKVHAVDVTTIRNQVLGQVDEGVSLCGWGVTVSELPFVANGLECRTCAAAAKKSA